MRDDFLLARYNRKTAASAYIYTISAIEHIHEKYVNDNKYEDDDSKVYDICIKDGEEYLVFSLFNAAGVLIADNVVEAISHDTLADR